MTNKQWGIGLLLTLGIVLGSIVGLTIYLDPLFHYHKPIAGQSYKLKDERYQNDGIAKRFDYDAIITGTSMTENFKVSQLNDLFGVNAAKMPFQGASFYEINRNIQVALKANPNVKMIVRGLDGGEINAYYQSLRSDLVYPDYLYDNAWWNDAPYVLNKDILINYTLDNVINTKNQVASTNFDEYANWDKLAYFGKAEVLATYKRPDYIAQKTVYTQADKEAVAKNLEHNLLKEIRENPQIQFYLFYPPYSMYHWDYHHQKNDVEYRIASYRQASEALLAYDNVHLFSFLDAEDIVLMPERYKDLDHYDGRANDQMLDWMKAGKYQLTKDGYQQYFDQLEQFVLSYDYDSLFE